MFIRLSLRGFWILLIVLASLWLGIALVSVGYSILFPPPDIQQIVHALQNQANPPSQAAVDVHNTIATMGSLQRAVQIGYRSTIRISVKHTARNTQVSYLAWFENLRNPIFLVIQRNEIDSVIMSYEIDEGEPMSMLLGLALPLIISGFSIYMLRSRESEPPKLIL